MLSIVNDSLVDLFISPLAPLILLLAMLFPNHQGIFVARPDAR